MNQFGGVNVIMRICAFLIATTIIISVARARAGEAPAEYGDCTIGVFGGDVTSDGRPMIWKNRDVGNPDQRFIHTARYFRNGTTTLAFTGNCYRNDSTRIYMGANECGFAIMNSDSYNLGDSLGVGIDDGTLMKLALETCRTLADFEDLLDSTNATGRRDCWNFGCLDSTGATALYECANYWYAAYRPEDNGPPSSRFILRANFSVSGGTNHTGQDRYNRACSLTVRRIAQEAVDAGFVLEHLARDLGNIYADPYPLPYSGIQNGGPQGYIFNLGVTICNRSTTSAVVIRGARGDEPAYMTTIFAILGQPVLSVAFPLWVNAGPVPMYLSRRQGAPVWEYCTTRSRRMYDNSHYIFHLNSKYLLDENNHGIFSYTFPLERWGIGQTDMLLETWGAEPPAASEIHYEQNRIACSIFAGFQRETAELIDDFPPEPAPLPGKLFLTNYPNPFNEGTYIRYNGARGQYPVTISIYDVLGRQVARLTGNNGSDGVVYWAGKDAVNKSLVSGIYFYTLDNGPFRAYNKMLLIK